MVEYRPVREIEYGKTMPKGAERIAGQKVNRIDKPIQRYYKG
jgi:hypothetical protein